MFLDQLRKVDVARGNAWTSSPHHTWLANRNGVLIVIQDVDVGVGVRLADRQWDSWPVKMSSVEHADLSWATDIPKVDMRSPLLSQSERTRLATDSDSANVGKVCNIWHVLEDHRRGSDDNIDSLETICPGLEAAAPDVEGATVHHVAFTLSDMVHPLTHVESNIELLCHVLADSDAEFRRFCQEGVGHASVPHINTLWSSGSTRCVDNICTILCTNIHHRIGRVSQAPECRGAVKVKDIDHVPSVARDTSDHLVKELGKAEHDRSVGVGDVETKGVVGDDTTIQWHVLTTSFQDGQNEDNHLNAARVHQHHTLTNLQAVGLYQLISQHVGPSVELAICDGGPIVVPNRSDIGVRQRNRLECVMGYFGEVLKGAEGERRRRHDDNWD
ncbi:hypothetical protein HG530_010844 [Fusarium avenaceum]|nr:hypothetical protein HG530_010844 [Fusarium avenaceum]